MSAILASFLPDFSAALPPGPARLPAPPYVAPRPAPPQAPQPVPAALAAVAAGAADPFTDPWGRLKRSAPPAAPTPAELPEDRAALLAEAEAPGRAEGLAQGLAEARAEAEAVRAQEQAAFEARFAAARRDWCEGEAAALASGFAAALRALDGVLSERIAALLAPVLTDALRRRAVAELGEALARLLADPQAASVRVCGPEDLLAALGRQLGPLADTVVFEPGDTAEVTVVADQTVIETQIAAWTRLLAAAAEG